MVLTQERQWWNGHARRRLATGIAEQARLWQIAGDNINVDGFDFRSRMKVGFLFCGFFAVISLNTYFPGNTYLSLCSICMLGLFFIPYTRIFMHSQMHWGLGGGQVLSFLFEHFISLIFSVPQTSYTAGHRMHHRFDNDFNATGLPKDLQSTYIFSRDGRPCNMLLWTLYYMFIFQHLVAPWLVFREGKKSEKFWLCIEVAAIVAFHLTLHFLSPRAYVHVYLPSLLVAWFASAVVLYMMHAVDIDKYTVHPTNTSTSKFFNRFGDNDGYHLEHTLFPAVHPIYLQELHKQLQPSADQVLKKHYFVAGVKYAFSKSSRPSAQSVRITN